MTLDFLRFPKDLLSQAVSLGNELAWPKKSALAVLEFSRRAGIAVLGVEAWLPEGASPRVLAVSDYEVSSDLEWSEFVDENEKHARQFLEAAAVPSGCLFNFTMTGAGGP